MSDDRPFDEPGPEPRDDNPEDVGATTDKWQAFASEPAEPERPGAVGAPFRIVTLLAGLVVFALIVWLLLR